jgi:hypothetical protein
MIIVNFHQFSNPIYSIFFHSIDFESDCTNMRWMYVLVGMVAASCLLMLLAEALPAHFACKRKIKVGGAVMAGHFQQSNAVSIKLGSIPCGGTLKTGVLYTPNPRGLDGLAHYLIDVTKPNGDPFPGAIFIKGAHIYDGSVLKSPGIAGNLAAWSAFPPPRLAFSGKPATCPTRSSNFAGSKLKFSTPGTLIVRIAWSHGPLEGAMLSAPCRYTVTRAHGKGEHTATTTPDVPAPAAEPAPDQPAAPADAAEARV